MEKLFGIPMDTIMVAFLTTFVVVCGVVAALAVRSRVMLRLGIRNIPRRPGQTVLIILGLMLGTLIVSAAFGTGDTMTHTIKTLGLESLGQIDEIIAPEGQAEGQMGRPSGQAEGQMGRPSALGRAYIDYTQFEKLRDQLRGYDQVDGLAPAIFEVAPVVDATTQQNASRTLVFGLDPAHATGFDTLVMAAGGMASLEALAEDEVYINQYAAKELGAQLGDRLELFAGGKTTVLRLKAVVNNRGTASNGPVLLMPIKRAQALFGQEGRINRILVSNRGDALTGAVATDEVVEKLKGLLAGANLEVDASKKKALDLADTLGSVFTSLFVVFGLFSIAAGVLLIFLIFVMLAAERKPEMGMARAVGTQRRHLIEMFLFEGTVYDLVAAAVGALLGVGVGYLMVEVMVRAFAQQGMTMYHYVQPRSLIVAYTLGMLITFITVTISAWRVSRLNIVRAIRDLPEPKSQRGNRRWLVLGLLGLVVGTVLSYVGIQAVQLSSFMLGTSLVIIGLALAMRPLGVPDRAAFTFAGVALLVWWLLPSDVLEPYLPKFTAGLEMFFLSGIMIVAGAVWTVIYNSDILLTFLTSTLGCFRGLAPVLKTAVAYPMHHKFRTGMTLAMFSLIIFAIVFMSVLIGVSEAIFSDVESLSGGFDIRGDVSYNNPIGDIKGAIKTAPNLNIDDFEAIAGQSTIPVQARQKGYEEWRGYLVRGVDEAYLDNITYDFLVKAAGYSSAREIWQAVRDNPGLAVVDSMVVPARAQYSVVIGGTEFRVEGVYQEDKTMSPLEIEVQEPMTGIGRKLTVIGVVDASFGLGFMGLYTSQRTLDEMSPFPIPPTTYFFKVKPGVDAEKTAYSLEAQFLTNGMEAEAVAETIRTMSNQQRTIFNLMQGFMGLGLVVGIAALGVISARSVVERRQQIGMLRAIGFQRGMVQLSFFLESSFIAILGILIGIFLGLMLAYNVVDFMAKDIEGLRFEIPWLEVVYIGLLAYGASILTTYLPARQAANVYPAQALRYE